MNENGLVAYWFGGNLQIKPTWIETWKIFLYNCQIASFFLI